MSVGFCDEHGNTAAVSQELVLFMGSVHSERKKRGIIAGTLDYQGCLHAGHAWHCALSPDGKSLPPYSTEPPITWVSFVNHLFIYKDAGVCTAPPTCSA